MKQYHRIPGPYARVGKHPDVVIIYTIIILILFIFFLSTCGGQSATTATTTTQPTTTQTQSPTSIQTTPTTTAWNADGIISPGEYTKSKSFGEYEVHWQSDDTSIFLAFRAKTSGWVALGIQPGSRMKNADMIFGFVREGETKIYDLFSTGDFGPHPPDIELGGTNNVDVFAGTEDPEYTTIEIKRDLDTGDEFDIALSSGLNSIIWAYGREDGLSAGHSARGYGELDL